MDCEMKVIASAHSAEKPLGGVCAAAFLHTAAECNKTSLSSKSLLA